MQLCRFSYTLCKFSSQKNPYGSTILLPKSSFKMKLENDKRLEMDQHILNSKAFKENYEKQRERNTKGIFIIHDGPPYANGSLHLGHSVNKIYKDICGRWKSSQGIKVDFRPGWDCHGLPIETAVSSLVQKSSLNIRNEARKFAQDNIERQKKEFESWGISADWKNPYLTFSPEYMKSELRIFYELSKKGLLFRDYKPVYWSPSSLTALAEAELEYNPNHSSSALYVKLPLVQMKNTFALIWTTTPWSLYSNQAICFSPKASYTVIEVKNEFYIVATALLHQLPFSFKIKGLENTPLSYYTYINFSGEECPLIPGDHVLLTIGTGLVHTAPAHGHDDFKIALEHKLKVHGVVNESGHFLHVSQVPKNLQGVSIFDTDRIVEHFSHSIVHMTSNYIHSYPYDWRTKQPVIIRASLQWFLKTDELKHRALDAITKVELEPFKYLNYFKENLMKRPFWCVSRQRVWGVPIPVFYNQNDEPIINEELINRYVSLIDTVGSDFWWSYTSEEILQGTSFTNQKLNKGNEILDVWFDSGISWFHTHHQNEVADLIIEGSDQFNGWFYTSLLTSVALRNSAPYKKILVHGFTMDENGRKMSKSLGNIILPNDIIKGSSKGNFKKSYGVDVLRYWVAAHTSISTSQILVKNSSFEESKKDLDKIRNALKFILGNLSSGQRESLNQISLLSTDQWILHEMLNVDDKIFNYYENLAYHKVTSALNYFLANELSLYFSIIKTRLYCSSLTSKERQSGLTTLEYLLIFVLKWLEPICPILKHEVDSMYSFSLSYNSLKEIPLENGALLESFLQIRFLLSSHRPYKYNLVIIPTSDSGKEALSKIEFSSLCELFQVSHVILGENANDFQHVTRNFSFSLVLSTKDECPRCKRYTREKEEELCALCAPLVFNIQVK